MKLPRIMVVLIGIALYIATVGCSSAPPESISTTNIDASVVVVTTTTQKSVVAPIPANAPTSATDTLTLVPAQQAIRVRDTDALRQLTFAYWDALNSYDAGKAVSYLEENYRQAHRGEVEKGINQMKMFGVKLGVSEESPPRIKGVNEAEMYVALKEPLGTRRILMKFATVEGEWKITFAEEVE